MTSDNFDSALIALRNRKPFEPFYVVLMDGDRFEVDHHDALVVRDGVAIYVKPGGVPVIFDHDSVTQFVGGLLNQMPEQG